MTLVNCIAQIQFKFGAIGLLEEQCDRMGIGRPLIVNDQVMKATPIINSALNELRAAGSVALYDGTPPNPNEVVVRGTVSACEEGNCNGIVAAGGNSSIDLAHGLAVCAAHDGPLQSFAVIAGGLGLPTLLDAGL